MFQNCVDTDSCEGNHNCGEDAHCVNMPGPMSMCRPNPKITKPTKPPVLQGEWQLLTIRLIK